MLNFLQGISNANGVLLQEAEINSCLQKVVEVLGEATQVDRCYIFTNRFGNDGELKLYYTHEWCNINIEPELENPSLSDVSYALFSDLFETLITNKPYFGLVKDNTSQIFRDTLEMQNIHAYLFTPIFCMDEFWGYIGYDDCTIEREWKKFEIDVLFSVAKNIGLRLHRENSDKKFRISEERLNLAISVSKQGLCEWNLKNDNYIFSPYFMEMLGYTHHEFEHTYKNWKNRVNPEDLTVIEKNLNNYLKKKSKTYESEYRMRHKKGYDIWIKSSGVAQWDKEGNPIYMNITQMEITESKAQQVIIEQQRNEYDQLINNLAQAFFRLNKKNEFIFLNDYWLNISGYNKRESLNDTILNYVIDEDRAYVEKRLRSLSELKKSTVFETKLKNKRGEICWVQIMVRKFSTDLGAQKSAIAGSIIDITHSKVAEQKSIELADLKSNFITMASHQFLTPLTVVYSNIELLENYSDKFEKTVSVKVKTMSERIKSEINRITDLMNNILLLGRYNSRELKLNSKPMNLSELCESVINTYFNRQKDERIVEFENMSKSNRLVHINELFFTYIMTNILSNAFKFSAGKRNPKLMFNYKPECAQFEVRDYGIGVPKNEINKLFNSFYRASNTSTISGSGLGLVVAKQFMELHGGQIDLKSKLGKGTTITLSFPYAKTKNPAS